MTTAVPFPSSPPPGYEQISGEPRFDPERHLDLQEPDEVVTLHDLGYSDDDIAGIATPVAASSPFRVLSDEGAAVMLDVARRLRSFVQSGGGRIERIVRGGCYRSAWLRDLCTSPEVTRHVARIYGVPVAPHPMGLHLGHLNYEPTRENEAIDKWHHDTLPLDIVMMVTDPTSIDGGRFEYFVGTKAEAAELAAAGRTPPADRIIAPEFAGPGVAIALHGNMVVHRAGPVNGHAERISMVNGYVSHDTGLDEQSRTVDLIAVDDHLLLWAEWAKMAAWRSGGRLAALVDDLPFTDDREYVISQLEAAVEDVQRAIAQMRTSDPEPAHYGG